MVQNYVGTERAGPGAEVECQGGRHGVVALANRLGESLRCFGVRFWMVGTGIENVLYPRLFLHLTDACRSGSNASG